MAERVVSWKVLADFAAISKSAKKAEADLESLRKKQRQINAESAGSDTSGTSTKSAQAANAAAAATDRATSAVNRNLTAQQKQVAASRASEAAQRASARATHDGATAMERLAVANARGAQAVAAAARVQTAAVREHERSAAAHERSARAVNQHRDALGRFSREAGGAGDGAGRLRTALGAMRPNWDLNTRGALRFGSALRLLAIPVIITGVNALISVLNPLAAGFMGLAGAIAPVTGLLATLPGLLAAAAGGVGTLLAGFAGIGGALKAYGQQQKNAAKLAAQGTSSAQKQANAQRKASQAATKASQRAAKAEQNMGDVARQNARNIRNAKEQLADAYERQGDAARNAARSIEMAERSLADAQKRSVDAQRAVSQAREDAKRQLEDLREAARDYAREEEGASQSVEEAKLRLQRTLNDPASTDLERRQAELAVRDAENALSDVDRARQDNDKKLKDAQRKGIEGSDLVVDAREAERDALLGVRDAQIALADAQRDGARAQRDAARAVRDAREGLGDAYRNAKNASRDAKIAAQDAGFALDNLDFAGAAKDVDLFAEAMKDLSPEARAVVMQLIAMKPLIDQLRTTAQKGMLPGFLSLLQDLEKVFPSVNSFVATAAKDFGDFFRRVGDGLSSPGGLRTLGVLFKAANNIIARSLDIFYDLGVFIGNVGKAAENSGLNRWLMESISSWVEFWKESTSGAKGQNRLARFFRSTMVTGRLLGRVIGGLSRTIFNLGKGTAGLGRWMLRSLGDITQGWAKMTGSIEGQDSLKQWGERSKPALSALSDLIETLWKGLGELGKKIDITALLKQINDELVPALLSLMAIFTGDLAKDIVSLISHVANFIAAFGPEGGGALGAFVSTLDTIVGQLTWLVVNVPGATSIIAGLFAAFAVKKAAGVVGSLTGLTGFVGALNTTKKKGGGLGGQAGRAPQRIAGAIGSTALEMLGLGGFVPNKSDKQSGKAAGKGGAKRAGGTSTKTAAPRRMGGMDKGQAQALKTTGALADKGAQVASKLPGVLAKAIPVILSFGGVFLRILPWISKLIFAIPGVGWVIGGIITALSIAVPLIIRHWDSIKGAFFTALNAIIGFFAPIIARIAAVWEGIVGVLGPPIGRAIEAVLWYFRLLGAQISVLLQIIGTILRIGFELYYAFIVKPFLLAFAWVVKKLSEFGAWIGRKASTIVTGFKLGWALFYDAVIVPVRNALSWVGTKFTEFGAWLSKKAKQIQEGVSLLWAKFKDSLPKPLKDALTGMQLIWADIKKGFEGLVSSIGKALAPLGKIVGTAFDKIKKAASDPIGTLVSIVNGGLIDPYLSLAGKLGIATSVKRITWNPPGKKDGGVVGGNMVPGFAHGGTIPGTKSQTHRDNVLGVTGKGVPHVRVEPGEYILPRWMSPIFGTVERMRRMGPAALEGFAAGGQTKRRKRRYLDGLDEEPRYGLAGGGLARPVSGGVSRGIHGSPPAVDIGTGVGHTVVAGHDGTVTSSRDIRGHESRAPHGGLGYRSYGRVITISGGGKKTLYAHLSKRSVSRGSKVSAGNPIGKSGNTGYSFGPHLHFGASGISPYAFLKGGFRSSGSAGPGDGGSGDGKPIYGKSLWDKINPLNAIRGLWDKVAGRVADLRKGNIYAKLAAAIPGKIKDGMWDFLVKHSAAAKKRPVIGYSGGGGSDDAGSGKSAGQVGGGRAGARQAALNLGASPVSYHKDPSGYPSFDAMIQSKSEGNSVAAHLRGNRKKYGLRYLIWNMRIASARQDWAWRRYSPISSSGDFRHVHHVHASFRNGGKVKGKYARGTNSAQQGWALVGEQGPELVKMRGGEQVKNAAVTSASLPGYHAGGAIRGVKPGARGNWVAMLNSLFYNGVSTAWGSSLTKLLTGTKGGLGRARVPSKNIAARVWSLLWGRYRNKNFADSIPWIASLLKVDPTNMWADGSAISSYITGRRNSFKPKKKKMSKSQSANYKAADSILKQFNAARSNFSKSRAAWTKSLESVVGTKQDGVWDSTTSAGMTHLVRHALGIPHSRWESRPWQPFTDTEKAIQETERSNALNAEFDKYLAQFEAWGFDYIVRKMNDLGVADGMTLARSLVKSYSGSQEYNKNLGVAYDREDAKNGNANNKSSQLALIIRTVGAGTTTSPIGLQGASSAVQLSMDSTAALYADLQKMAGWLAIPQSKRSRFESDVANFRNLFRFATGGSIPGQGNGDRVPFLGEPGEFVLRKAAVSALERRFGRGFTSGYLNQADRFANGGFVASGLSTPNFSPSSVRLHRSSTSQTSETSNRSVVNNFNTVVNNPTLEDGAVSVQKRVTRVARQGILG